MMESETLSHPAASETVFGQAERVGVRAFPIERYVDVVEPDGSGSEDASAVMIRYEGQSPDEWQAIVAQAVYKHSECYVVALGPAHSEREPARSARITALAAGLIWRTRPDSIQDLEGVREEVGKDLAEAEDRLARLPAPPSLVDP